MVSAGLGCLTYSSLILSERVKIFNTITMLVSVAEFSRLPIPISTVNVRSCPWSFYEEHRNDVRILMN